MKKVIIADKAGFCFGVKRAMNMAYKEIEEKDNNMQVYALGPLIHNRQAVEKYEERGLITVNEIEEIEIKENIEMIIRSHGVAKKVYDDAKIRGIEIVDTTCPFVKKIHDIVRRSEEDKKTIILLGDKNHPEVIGINGWCKDSALIFKDLDDVLVHEFNYDEEYIVVSQTTMNEENFEKIIDYLKSLDLELDIQNTICSATRVRQQSARELSSKVDVMVVIGGKHSSNTQKLVNICKEKRDTVSIETRSDLYDIDFSNYETIGVTAGASTPDWIIHEAIEYLENLC